MLAPYYETLGLGAKPLTVEEFARTPPPALPIDKKDSEFDKARYGHLRRDYYSNVKKYRHLLKSPTVEIGENKIKQYVTQDATDESGEKIVNYLAVKEVEISCSFPHEDIGQISLLDLPGLGDTNLIEAERLIKIISEEADLILFVRRPEANAVWGEAHLKLYQIARNALSNFPLSKCSFMILNRTKHGVEGGDIIVGLAGRKILNIYDYTDAMAALKVGEETEIVVKRGEEELTLKLTPGSRD